MDKESQAPEAEMMRWLTHKWVTRPIRVVVELGVPDLRQNGSQPVAVLAGKTGTHPPTLYRLLRALSTVGIFEECDGRMFATTPLGRSLCSDALGPIAGMFLSH